jgi:hypothetical protein
MNHFALLVKCEDGSYEFHTLVDDSQIITVSGKKLHKTVFDTNFLGFYDWLRDATGSVIGLRIKLEFPDSRKYSDLIKLFFSAAESADDLKIIFFGNSREYFDHLSDDTDFCDFSIYQSENLVAITFNMPTQRKVELMGSA